MFSGALLLLLLLAGHRVCGQVTLNQPGTMTLQPGQSLSLSCQVSGYSLTDSSYCTNWIRQPGGKSLEWIGYICYSGNTGYSDKLKSKFSISRDTSSSTVTLSGQSLQPEDTAVYYCARYDGVAAFAYWGKGTLVTVSSATVTGPTVFPLTKCDYGTEEMVTLGCLALGYTPSSALFKWTDASGTALTDYVQYPALQKNNLYTGFSHLRVKREDWDLKKTFKCTVEHSGENREIDLVKPDLPAVQLPTLAMFSSSEAKQATVSFACFATDFSPSKHQIRWSRNGQDITQKVSEITTVSDQSRRNGSMVLYSAASFLKVDAGSLTSPETPFTCTFEAAGGETVNKSVTHSHSSSGGKCPSEELDVKIVPLSLEEMFFNRKAELVCEVTTHLESMSIQWEDDEGRPLVNKTLPTIERNGTPVIRVAVDVLYDEWSKGLDYSCVVEHKDILGSVRESFKKQNGQVPKRPAVFLLPPVEQPKSDSVTLTCFVKDFYPKEIVVSWLVDDEPITKQSRNYSYDNTDHIQNDGLFSVYGQLRLSHKSWKEEAAVYSCVVYHESVVDTTRVLVRSMMERGHDHTNLVNLSIDIPEQQK